MKVKHYLERIKKTTVYNHNSNSEIIKDLVQIAILQTEQIDTLWMQIKRLEIKQSPIRAVGRSETGAIQ